MTFKLTARIIRTPFLPVLIIRSASKKTDASRIKFSAIHYFPHFITATGRLATRLKANDELCFSRAFVRFTISGVDMIFDIKIDD